MNIRGFKVEGGGACPEQHDVYLDDKEVGYLRLRHGIFTADCPFGKTVYVDHPQGDGIFYDEERGEYLKKAVKAIEKEMMDRGTHVRGGCQTCKSPRLLRLDLNDNPETFVNCLECGRDTFHFYAHD